MTNHIHEILNWQEVAAIDAYEETDNPSVPYEYLEKHYKQAKAQLQTLVEQMMNEVIGEDYQIPNDNLIWDMLRYANEEKADQRQRIPTIVAQYFGGEK